jgi:hypothetical protein
MFVNRFFMPIVALATLSSFVHAQLNELRFSTSADIEIATNKVVGAAPVIEPAMTVLLAPSTYPSTVNEAYVAVQDGSVVEMSSCKDYVDAGFGLGQDGVYQITNNGSTYPVYCNQTSFGGGFTLVAAQYEFSSVHWRGSNNGTYNPTLNLGNGFSLPDNQIPSHSVTGFSQEVSDGLSIPNYITFNYSTGDIPKTEVVGSNGLNYHIYRNQFRFYGDSDPDGILYNIADGSNVWDYWRSMLTIDRAALRGDDFSFAPFAGRPDYRGLGYGGTSTYSVNVNGGYFIWVR